MRTKIVVHSEWAPFCLLLCFFCDADLAPLAVALFFLASAWGD